VFNWLITAPWRRMGKWMYRSTFSWPRHQLEVSGQLHAPATLLVGKAPGTHWIEDWVNPRASLGDMEKRTFFTLPRLELPSLSHPAHSQSLHRLTINWLLFLILITSWPTMLAQVTISLMHIWEVCNFNLSQDGHPYDFNGSPQSLQWMMGRQYQCLRLSTTPSSPFANSFVSNHLTIQCYTAWATGSILIKP
jgi:hypothetical protein